MPVLCLHCNSRARCVTGKDIYPHRSDLYKKSFWLCDGCGAYCGCHGMTKKPLGHPANKETSDARMMAHRKFDPLWKSGRFGRNEAYRILAAYMGIKIRRCHIGRMTASQCKQVLEFVEKLESSDERVVMLCKEERLSLIEEDGK